MTRREQHILDLEDKNYAVRRLTGLRQRTHKLLDEEEADHIDEALRIIIEDVPAIYFRGFGDFRRGKR